MHHFIDPYSNPSLLNVCRNTEPFVRGFSEGKKPNTIHNDKEMCSNNETLGNIKWNVCQGETEKIPDKSSDVNLHKMLFFYIINKSTEMESLAS